MREKCWVQRRSWTQSKQAKGHHGQKGAGSIAHWLTLSKSSLQGWRRLGEGLYHPKQTMHTGQMQLAFTQQFMSWFQRSLQV